MANEHPSAVLSTISRTTNSSRVIPGPSSKPLRRQLTWGDGGRPSERSTMSKMALKRSNTEPQQPSDNNPFLVPVADSDDEFFTSVSREPSSDPPSPSVRPTVVKILEITHIPSSFSV